jgi:hypothetical protein
MDDKKKKIIFFVASLFAALIFITSYAAFGANSTTSSTTTIPSAANTVFVYGSANAVIVNYSYTATISAQQKSQLPALNNTLGKLVANGSISNYVPLNATAYQAILSTINQYQLQQYLSKALNTTNVLVGGYAYVTLPATVNMYYSAGSQIPITFPQKNYSVYLPRASPIGSNVLLKVQVLVTTQGKIYNNQIRLSES